MDIVAVAAELQRYVVQNKKVSKADFARALTTTIDAHCKKVTKIKGVYQTLDSIMSHVVQGFKPQWQELGVFSVRDKELKNYHQKVNFPIIPAEVLSTALAEWYEEDKEITDMMICKEIIDWLLIQVGDDMELLSMIAVYDAVNAAGVFGKSLNGWNKIVELALANTVRPCYKVPLDAFVDNNVYDNVLAFERGLPRILKRKIKKIFISENNLERFTLNYMEKFNVSPNFKEEDKVKSPLGKRELVGLPNLEDDKIFATIDGNMLNLIDVNDNPPKISSIQVQDYKVKIFMEFWKGYDFLINEAVVIGDMVGEVVGLGDDDLMEMYYPHEIAA